MNIEQELYNAAVEFLQHRYPVGPGYAAAMRTVTGKILTSVPPEVKNLSLEVCVELGAYLEAFKINEAVTHSICICRDDEHSDILILSPCGICRERLAYWGGDVKAAISTKDNQLVYKTIRELLPDHWGMVDGEIL